MGINQNNDVDDEKELLQSKGRFYICVFVLLILITIILVIGFFVLSSYIVPNS